MSDPKNEADLLNDLVEIALLREYKQLSEILNENKDLLKIKVIHLIYRIKRTIVF